MLKKFSELRQTLLRVLAILRTSFSNSELRQTLLPALAILLTVFSIVATHKHDRLSVLPKISFVWDTVSDPMGLFIENSGAGPAIIKEVCISGVKGVGTDEACKDPDNLLKSNRIFKDEPAARSF
jgi:hypothetical protein